MNGDYSELKAAIASVIKTNGRNEITGAVLQTVLLNMVTQIGDGATFKGIATPSAISDVLTPDANEFYIAMEAGTYSQFGGLELEDVLGIFYLVDGVWTLQSLSAYQLPEGGIPESDLTSSLQTTINDAKGYNIVEMDVMKSSFGINRRNTHAIANGIPTTFRITLPTTSNDEKTYGVSVQFVTGANSNITFAGARPVCYENGYTLDANSCYNIEALYNGVFWSVTATKMASFVVLTGNTNSVLFQLCYAQGWTSNSKMDNTEAAAITDIAEVFRAQTTLSSFNELSYFIGLTGIPANAFTGCTVLKNIILPQTITSIGEEAFMDCRLLEEITIPSGVTTIGARAFKNCTGLDAIHVKAAQPPSLGTDALFNTNNCTIYVPAASINTYRGLWMNYVSRIQAE